MALTDKFKTIGNAIRKKLGNGELIPLDEMPEKVNEVYEAGVKSGRDNFWDCLQKRGGDISNNYAMKFCNKSQEIFYPTQDLIIDNGSQTFRFFSEVPINLIERLEECGVKMDTSQCVAFTQMFQYANITHIPTIDMRNDTINGGYVFCTNKIKYVEKIILSEKNNNPTLFSAMNGVEHMIVDGVIANIFNIQWCKNLDRESLLSVIACLKDNSGTDTWQEVILGEENLDKLTTEEKEIMTKKQWNYS